MLAKIKYLRSLNSLYKFIVTGRKVIVVKIALVFILYF